MEGGPVLVEAEAEAEAEAEEEEEVVDLNVGGTHYSTTKTTLLRCDSMLARMFSGLLPVRKRQSDGRVFIDRDGELFRFVLQFLRDGDLDVEDMDKHLVARLKREAAFFCLQELEQKLDTLQKGQEQPSPQQPTQGEEPEHIVAYLVMTTSSLNQVQINGRLLEYTPYFSELSKVVSQNAQYTIAALCNYFSKRGYKLVTSYSTAPPHISTIHVSMFFRRRERA